MSDLEQTLTRRRWLALGAAAGGAWWLAGCGAPAWRWLAVEQTLVDARRGEFEVVIHDRGPLRKVLRRRARPVPASLDLARVSARMERTMRAAKGVGIAGPQVGLSLRVTTLMLDYRTDHPRVVFVRNPMIVERSAECLEGYEGCLSVPGVGGLVRRNRWIKIEHQGPGGETLVAEAEGPNAVLWQHELDHLDGVLYLDRLLGELLPMEEVRRRRRQQRTQREDEGPRASLRQPRPLWAAELDSRALRL